MVSHDRDLSESRRRQHPAPRPVGRLSVYAGGYDDFEATRAARLSQQVALYAKQQAERRHIQSFIDRFRYKASKARQAQSRIKALERMAPIAAVSENRTVRFDFPTPEPLSPPLVTLRDVAIGYGENPVLQRLNLNIDSDDRIALLGANGNGKSTLIKLLADRLKPQSGTLRKSPKLKVGYFAQHQADELVLSRTPVEEALVWQPMATETAMRTHLGAFGFTQERADTAIGKLSGGEKARLLLALMTREKPHILLLDEPTNHLDVDSRQALVQALNAYDGAVILISHDPHLVEATADRLWLVAGGTCTSYDGDLEDYRRLLAETRAGPSRAAKANGKDLGPTRKDQRRAAADARAALAPLRRRIRDTETEIERLNKKRAKLETELADPDLYAGPPDAVTKRQIALSEIESAIAAAEERWLIAHEELEAAD